MSGERPTVAFDRFTPSQRRRAEALMLARLLFPGVISGKTQHELAEWVIYGRQAGAAR